MKLFKSIRWQLIFWQLLLLAGVLVTLLSLYYHLHRKDLIAATDQKLQLNLMFVMPSLSPGITRGRADRPRREHQDGATDRHHPGDNFIPPSRNPRYSPGQQALQIEERIEEQGMYVASWYMDGRKNKFIGDVPESLAFDDYRLKQIREPMLFERDGNREIVFIHAGSVCVVLGEPLSHVEAMLRTLLVQLVLIGSGVLAVGFVGGWIITRRVLRPVKEISETAQMIAGGNSNQRIQLSDAPLEMADLSKALNSSFDHLDESIQLQKQFSADASHELRTPIAVVIAQCQAALKRDRSTDEYKSVLNACLRAGERMKSMANSLLELTRIDSQGMSMTKVLCCLDEVVQEAAEEADLLSPKHSVTYTAEGPVGAYIDRHRMHQIILNLLNNAVLHNPEGCPVHVDLRKADDMAQIRISDEGEGIPPEALPHIFDRFYRVDKSRSRAHGGTGLGLCIVKKLVEAHSGHISVESVQGRGTLFTIKLPFCCV
jgi:heavy metal sensor kinase